MEEEKAERDEREAAKQRERAMHAPEGLTFSETMMEGGPIVSPNEEEFPKVDSPLIIVT